MDLDLLLSRLGADPDYPVDLAELNFRFAAEVDDPELDLPVYLSKLDDFAEELAPRLHRAGSLEDRAMELGHFLFEEQGFAGNTEHYYDARNSFLHEVLDRRLGIPISLSVLAIAVGERCGLEMSGIGLPGHFIAKVSDGADEVLFDPFHGGALLTPSGCSELVSAVVGEPYAITAKNLKATPPGIIAMRMLNNLKAVYLQGGEFEPAAQVIEWLILLNRNDPTQYRDLGVALVHADQHGRAIDPLTHYLKASPDSVDAPIVKKFLNAARRTVAQWN
jgi:regulator of sirC expression with transglutaminase-like and TPR domain